MNRQNEVVTLPARKKELSGGIRLKTLKKNLPLLLMTLPMLSVIIVYNYIPMAGLVVAFKNFSYSKGLFRSEWIGFGNFRFFFESQDAWRITRNTLGYNFAFIILKLIVCVAVALLLYEITSRTVLKVYQTVMFFPHYLSWVVIAYMAYAFLNARSGLANTWLESLGMDRVDWYITPRVWIYIFPFANTWKVLGMTSLMYYSSLLGIDSEYFEAAQIEGASKWLITRKIVIPFLYPLIIMLTILDIGHIFNSDFGLFYQLPMNSAMLYETTDVLETYIFRALQVRGDVGMSSAAGLFKSFVGFMLVLLANYTVKKIDQEYTLF